MVDARSVQELHEEIDALRLRIADLVRERGDGSPLGGLGTGKYRALFEFAPIGIAIVDPECTIVECNPAFSKMTGLRATDPKLQDAGWLFSLPADGDRGGFDELVDGAKDSDRHTFQWYAVQGEAEWLEVLNSAIRYPDGALRYVISMAMDVTQRMQEELNRKQLVRRIAESREEQTRLIAKELHDQVGQLLTGLKLQLETGTPESIEEALQTTLELMQEVRLMSHDLRPAALDQFGLKAALDGLVLRVKQRLGVEVVLDCRNEPHTLPAPAALTAYRFIQEGLSNVAKHAGVQRATVTLSCTESEIHLSVSDEGLGTARQLDDIRLLSDSMGIESMFDRVAAHGGTYDFQSTPGMGTIVSAKIPLAD